MSILETIYFISAAISVVFFTISQLSPNKDKTVNQYYSVGEQLVTLWVLSLIPILNTVIVLVIVVFTVRGLFLKVTGK